MEHDVVFADEMEHACLGVFPPFGIVVTNEVDCVGDISDRRIEPDIEHLAVGSLYGHGYAPVEVAADSAGLETHVEP